MNLLPVVLSLPALVSLRPAGRERLPEESREKLHPALNSGVKMYLLRCCQESP